MNQTAAANQKCKRKKKYGRVHTVIAAIGARTAKMGIFQFPKIKQLNSQLIRKQKKKIKSSSMFSKNTMKQRPEESDGILQFIKAVKKEN